MLMGLSLTLLKSIRLITGDQNNGDTAVWNAWFI